jgi:DNA-binding GntR family transcriptional regulator
MTNPAMTPLSTLAPRTATDQIFDVLYSAVISLQLPPGTKVSEAELAKQLDVSRQPVRDAFFRLSKLGFLSIRPQRATQVTRISEKAVLDAAFVRTAIEAECLRHCAKRWNETHSRQLHANLAQQTAALNDPDRSNFHALDEAFHRMLCEIAGHAHAWELIREQKAHMDRVRYLTLSENRRREVHAEHTAIIDALDAGDATKAERILREHLGEIRSTVRTMREEHAAYFEDYDAGLPEPGKPREGVGLK